MNLINPPEIADGGYWYAVAVDSDGIPWEAIQGPGWVCWYFDGLGALRTPKAVSSIVTTDSKNINSILLSVGANEKPRGRVGG